MSICNSDVEIAIVISIVFPLSSKTSCKSLARTDLSNVFWIYWSFNTKYQILFIFIGNLQMKYPIGFWGLVRWCAFSSPFPLILYWNPTSGHCVHNQTKELVLNSFQIYCFFVLFSRLICIFLKILSCWIHIEKFSKWCADMNVDKPLIFCVAYFYLKYLT